VGIFAQRNRLSRRELGEYVLNPELYSQRRKVVEGAVVEEE
jgi:hypothetical protein